MSMLNTQQINDLKNALNENDTLTMNKRFLFRNAENDRAGVYLTNAQDSYSGDCTIGYSIVFYENKIIATDFSEGFEPEDIEDEFKKVVSSIIKDSSISIISDTTYKYFTLIDLDMDLDLDEINA